MISKLLNTFCSLAEKSNTPSFSVKYMMLTLALIAGWNTQAQVSSYVNSGTSGGGAPAYVDLAPGGTSLFTNTWGDAVAAAPIGFNFNFNGKVYTSCFVSTNGFITFGSAPTATNYTPISSTENYEGAISIMGCNLNSNNLPISYLTTGAVGNRTFTVEYIGVRNAGTGVFAGTYYAQIILHESDPLNVTNPGLIEFRYKQMAALGGATLNVGMQIGLRGERNHDFNNRLFTLTSGAWTSPTLVRGPAFTSTVLTRTASPSINQVHNFTFNPPACLAPRMARPVAINVGANDAGITWTAPTPAPVNGYQYMVVAGPPAVNVNAGSPNAGSSSPFMGTTTGLTGSVSGLTANTLYSIYVRSDCGGYGGWSAAGSFTTLCNPTPIPPLSGAFYTENFSGATVPSAPTCTKIETNSGNNWVSSNATAPNWGFADRHMRIAASGTTDNEAWFFTSGVTLTAGQSYRLSYKYGASEEFASTQQVLSISYGTAPVGAAMTTQLIVYPDLKGGPYTNVINFTPTITQTYYFGFLDESLEDQATTLVDDIDIRETVCFAPTMNAATGITSGSAFISWTPPAVPAGSGYQYYYAVGVAPPAPTAATVPIGSTLAGVNSITIGGLSQSTPYCVWVRSNCGSGDVSAWSLSACFTTLAGAAPATCNPSGLGFSQDPQGITNVTFSNVNNTTGIELGNYGDYTYLTGYAGRGTAMPLSVTYRTGYSYDTTIWVDWDNNGTFTAAEIVDTDNSAATVPATVNMTVNIPVGAILGPHRMRVGGIDFGPLADPCRAGTWQAFEDYTLWVTTPPPPITLTAYSGTACMGTPIPINITSTLSNYATYTWEPAGGVTGTAPNFFLSPMVTTVYTLSCFNPVTFHRTSVNVTITVNNAPTAVSITPGPITVCQNAPGPLAPLTVSGGIISGVAIYQENFNGSAPGWVQTNTTSGATNPADNDLAAWALAPDGYAPFFTAIHSNDNSQFAFTESDATGTLANVNTTLTSPPINLVGYSAASLDFYHFYKNFLTDLGDESARVEVTTDNGANWTTLFFHDGASPIGSETNFVLQTLSLTPYVNNTVKIRFTYLARYDWGWGIDNFVVTGSGPSTYTWAPTTGLFTDAAGTIAYTGAPSTAVVYPRPNITTNYTVTATAFGCPVVSPPVTVTVTPISAGTITTANQNICSSSAAAPIATTGVVGTWVWQWATDAAFTTPNTIVGSNNLTTLSSALIGTFTTTRYFRIFNTVSGCTAVSNPVHVINITTTTWGLPGPGWNNGTPDATKQVVFTSNYTAAANFSACAIQVTGCNVTVNSGVTLTVTNGVNVGAGATLAFADDASLVQINNTVNTGNISYARQTTPIRKFDYTYWSSPVSPQTLFDVSPTTLFDKYFWFNTTTYQWTSIAAPGSALMTPGRGYIIRGPQGYDQFVAAPYTATFIGVPNNGNIIVPVGHNSAINNLDCIGNPYPSAISANLFMTNFSNAAALGAGGTTLYFWTHNTPITNYQYATNDYASYNYSGGVGTGSIAGSSPCAGCNNAIPTGNIAAGQGFMVKTVAAGNVTFRNTMRLTGVNNQFFRQENQTDAIESLERNRVWLELSNTEGAYKQTMVGYIENATNGLDSGFDGELVEAGNPVSLYSVLENSKLTIQGKALPFDINDQIPLGYRTTIPGTFQINLGSFDGFFDTTGVYLEDTLLGNIYDLKQSPHTFTTEVGTFDTRFILRYTSNSLNVKNTAFNENAVVVFKNDNSIFIETSNVNIKSVQLYDLRGRLIAEKDAVNSTKTEFSNLNIAQQVLLVQITSTDNVTVTKKIVF